jgi:SH3 domain protein
MKHGPHDQNGKDILMKTRLLLVAFFCLTTNAVSAQTMYVTDSFEVTMRTGRDTKHKIMALVTSNQKVEVTQQTDEWSFVRLQNGKEGWIMSRYLTSKTPKKETIKDLAQENEKLTRSLILCKRERNKFEKENKDQTKKLKEQGNSLTKTGESYESLKRESAGFLELKDAYEKASKDLAAQKKRVGALEIEVKSLRWNKGLKWFLSGAAILFVGILLGASFRKQRRSSLL